jgi:hypothetical protein
LCPAVRVKERCYPCSWPLFQTDCKCRKKSDYFNTYFACNSEFVSALALRGLWRLQKKPRHK